MPDKKDGKDEISELNSTQKEIVDRFNSGHQRNKAMMFSRKQKSAQSEPAKAGPSTDWKESIREEINKIQVSNKNDRYDDFVSRNTMHLLQQLDKAESAESFRTILLREKDQELFSKDHIAHIKKALEIIDKMPEKKTVVRPDTEGKRPDPESYAISRPPRKNGP